MPPPIPERSKNKSKFTQNLSIRINKDPQTFENWVSSTMDDVESDHFWDLQNPSVAGKLQLIMEHWQDFIDTRNDVPEGAAFAPETFYRYACVFIRAKVENTPGRRNPQLVHWSTVEGWLGSLIKVIQTFCIKDVDGVSIPAGSDLLRFGLEKGSKGLFVKLAEDAKLIFSRYSLDKWRPKKVYWTRYEVQMLVDEAFNTSASMEVALQQVLLITLAYVTSARVGAFGFTYKQWKKEGKYMKLQDIELYRDVKVPGAFEMNVHIKNVKGYGGQRGSTPLTMFLGSLKNPWNLFLEPTIPLIALLLHRGQLRDHTTLDSLLEGDEHQILYKNPADPLFYKCRPGGYGVDQDPARSNDLTEQVVYLANKAGLVGSKEYGGGSTKHLRTWGGEDVRNQLGETTAQQVLGHGAKESVLHVNYARGVATIDMAALRAHEAREGDVQRAEEAMMRHVSRSPAVRARAVRLAQGKPVEGIDNVSFIQVDSDGNHQGGPIDINIAKRTQVHTPETNEEINQAVLVDPEMVAAEEACSEAWTRLKSLTNLYITQDQKGGNLKRDGKPGYVWLEREVEDETPPEDATDLPEGWGTVAARKQASEEYSAARKERGNVRRRVQKRYSRGKTTELRNEYHQRLDSNTVTNIAAAISTLDAPSRTMKKVAATAFMNSSSVQGSSNVTLVDDEDVERELLLLAEPDPASETVGEDPYAHEDAPAEPEDAPASEDPDEEFFNAHPGKLNILEAKLRNYLREGTGEPEKKFDAKNRFSEAVHTSFDEERKRQLENEGIGNVPMPVLRVKYFMFLNKLLKSDKASRTSLHELYLSRRTSHQPKPEREVFKEQVRVGDKYVCPNAAQHGPRGTSAFDGFSDLLRHLRRSDVCRPFLPVSLLGGSKEVLKSLEGGNDGKKRSRTPRTSMTSTTAPSASGSRPPIRSAAKANKAMNGYKDWFLQADDSEFVLVDDSDPEWEDEERQEELAPPKKVKLSPPSPTRKSKKGSKPRRPLTESGANKKR